MWLKCIWHLKNAIFMQWARPLLSDHIWNSVFFVLFSPTLLGHKQVHVLVRLSGILWVWPALFCSYFFVFFCHWTHIIMPKVSHIVWRRVDCLFVVLVVRLRVRSADLQSYPFILGHIAFPTCTLWHMPHQFTKAMCTAVEETVHASVLLLF